MDIQATYDEIIAWYRELSMIGHIVGTLQWDQSVNLPPKGVPLRSEQLSFLQGLIHRKFIEPAMVDKVRALSDRSRELDDDGAANMREIRRDLDRAIKVPTELVEALSRHTSLSSAAWEEARHKDDFARFAPFLAQMVALKKEEAAALGFAERPYDAMLDSFEPGNNEEMTQALLDDLRDRLVPFYQRILGSEVADIGDLPSGPYAIEDQRAFGLDVIGELGFDFDGGRQDVSAHPFTMGTLGDVRITTRFSETDLRQSLYAMIHEAGHALYEQGLLAEHRDTPLGEAVSLGVHESQSRFWENIVGRSLACCKHMVPRLRETFPGRLGDIPIETFYKAINRVTPSLIRVEADEVTYNLHIIIRFEIERALVAGEVGVADLPELWRLKMKAYLDVDVPKDAEGVLQDVHWSEGLIGYFPTYTIGNLYSAQLAEAMAGDLGNLADLVEAGEFPAILGWLRERIHRHGKRYRAAELMERATGGKPGAAPFMRYLEGKYGPIYGLGSG